MKVAIYARVSTDKQENDNQLLVLREFCEKQGWNIGREYVDVVSGSGRKERPQFKAMLDAASRREFDLVLFWALDRFSREGVGKTYKYFEDFKTWGVRWWSYTQSFFNTDDELVRDLLLSMFATIAKQERLDISERTKAGLRRAKRQGVVLGRPTADLDMDRVRKLQSNGLSLRAIATKVGYSPSLLCKRLA